MKRNTKAPEQSILLTDAEKSYKNREKILYDEMMTQINSFHKSYSVRTIEKNLSKGWTDPVLKEIVIKEMAALSWGWRAGNYVHGVTNTIDFVFIGNKSYKGPGIPSVLLEPIPA